MVIIKVIDKPYFNEKGLILCVNHALLGFYLCQSRKHKSIKFKKKNDLGYNLSLC